MALFAMVAGCATKNIGDGQVDAVEDAIIRLAVGAAMTARPETVVPAYGVTKALLVAMDTQTTIHISILEKIVDQKLEALDLTPLEKQSMSDLVTLVRANIESRVSGLAPELQLVVVRYVIEIVHESAAVRLNLVKAGS